MLAFARQARMLDYCIPHVLTSPLHSGLFVLSEAPAKIVTKLHEAFSMAPKAMWCGSDVLLWG
jgi:hypothetical protein